MKENKELNFSFLKSGQPRIIDVVEFIDLNKYLNFVVSYSHKLLMNFETIKEFMNFVNYNQDLKINSICRMEDSITFYC